MANTDTAAIAGLVKAAYDRYVDFELRSQPMLRSLADKRPVQQAMPGSSVVFSLYNDLAATTATLDENVDPDPTAVANVSTVSVTLQERGRSVVQTRKLGEFAFADVDPAVANMIAFNMADSLDVVVGNTLLTGTQILYGTGGASTPTNNASVAAEDIIAAADIRKVVAKLRAQNVVPRMGDLYAAYIHPEVSHDLRAESGSGSFDDLNKYTDLNVNKPLTGVVGVMHGAMFVETPRVPVTADGASSGNVYSTFIVGQQALAEAVAVEPGVVIGPVVDRLMRFRSIGWYGLLGHSVYRNEALYQIRSSSSIA